MIPVSWIVTGVVVMVAGGYVLHCEHVKTVQAKSVAIAEAQVKENAKQALRDQKAKERADEDYKRRISRLSADLKRLREPRASLLPAPSPGAANPDRACFDRPILDSALRDYRAGVVGLLGEGAAAVEGLDEAKVWTQGR